MLVDLDDAHVHRATRTGLIGHRVTDAGAQQDRIVGGSIRISQVMADEKKESANSSAASPMMKSLPSFKMQETNTSRPVTNSKENDDSIIKMAGTQLNEEELEIPTFMRKKIGGK